MPTIKAFSACRVEIRFGDHNPPHFHVVIKDGRDALVTIEGLTVLSSRLKQRELAPALAWAADNTALLRDKWKECNP